ncbi:hypothetical protein VTH06DRAFT_7637 [Thermothelomyces fergusii]
MAATGSGIYDLLIITDATASMGDFLASLNQSLQDIIRISALTACFSRIGVVAYRDYDRHGKFTEWSGWHSRDARESETSQEALLSFVRSLTMHGGADWAEATKTGLALAHEHMRPEAKTIILLYCDAPPHTEVDGGSWKREQDELNKPGAYGGDGKLFADWVSAANTLAGGHKKAQVFGIIERGGWAEGHDLELESMITYLSTRTGGVCLEFPVEPTPADVSKLTIGLLLAWMGAEKEGAELDKARIASLLSFNDVGGIDKFASESEEKAFSYLPTSTAETDRSLLRDNMRYEPVSLKKLPEVIPRREHPVTDFAKRYRVDAEYQKIVVEQLSQIIEADVSAIALNPVFGALWRTVCEDRLNPARDQLISRFGLQVSRVGDPEKKALLSRWLEASYDFASEISRMIEAVPDASRYPCVFLDPTVRFSRPENAGDDANDDGSIELFSRDELLEIGRSCDPRILRRLGRILTRMTYVNSEEDLPAHVKEAPEDKVPRIPMALAQKEHGRNFWRVLLHVVLPGTMLGARPAALLAALSVRMGIQPLQEVAFRELVAWRDKWNMLDIPETWNVHCLSLLLEADEKYRLAVAEGHPGAGSEALLAEEDRKLFDLLVSYKLLEMNLDMELTAEVGWTPEKSRAPLGPVVTCRACQFPRSVTVMADNYICGPCAEPEDWESEEAKEAFIKGGVSAADTETTLGTWVECSVKTCRAQYVVYNPSRLRVRPKCHYCRQRGLTAKSDPNYETLTIAPCVECAKCKSRVIWPAAYRPSSFDPSTYQCPACAAGTPSTIATTAATPRILAGENGTAWLLRNDGLAIREPFSNRSIYHIVSTAAVPLALLPSSVSILPTSAPGIALTIRGKPVHNAAALVATLRQLVAARRVQAGTCSLCFASAAHRDLRLACGGRRGCRERICGECARGWYGLNGPGRVINLPALACPFCRRQPTTKVRLLPDGLRYLNRLRDAVEDGGTWVYAWCRGACASAKRFAPRSCAQGPPEEVHDWLYVSRPRCGVATEKVGGCDHVVCVCGKHWCFNCGEKFADTSGEIYQHMTEVHGTWFAFDDGGEDVYAYYEDDDGAGPGDENEA